MLRKVVNCFRSLYLWGNLQQVRVLVRMVDCCELLSFFVPLGEFTAYTLNIIANTSCELLSFFVPLGEFTANFKVMENQLSLWIAFVLCTFGGIYSLTCNITTKIGVVNCFRSLYLWGNLQPHAYGRLLSLCCELLSFFVPLGEFTAYRHDAECKAVLWIAFVLCTFGGIYSDKDKRDAWVRVVNCFRSLYLWGNLQLTHHRNNIVIGCELLSFFVPLGEFTATWIWIPKRLSLWIAFVLCTFGGIYSKSANLLVM